MQKNRFKKVEKQSNFLRIFKSHWLLIIILIFAFVVRVVGTIPGHPSDHPDEPMSYGSAIDMILHNDFNPRRYDYPAGVPLVHVMVYKTFFYPIAFFNAFYLHPSYLLENIGKGEAFRDQLATLVFGKNGVYALFWSRIITALLGTGCVLLTYVIGKKLFNRTTGLAAAFLLSANYRHVLSSHLALSDIPNCFFALLAFYCVLLLFEHPKRRFYVLSGILIGLSISMKYQVYSVIPFGCVQVLLLIKQKKLTRQFFLNILLSALLAVSVFVLLNPYLLLNLNTALPIIHIVSLRYGAGVKKFNFYPVFFLYEWGIGKLPFILIIFGTLLAVIRKPIKSMLLFSYTLPFLYTFLYYLTGGVYVRNFTTVIPFLMIFAGFGCFIVVDILRRFASKPLVTTVVFILLLAISYPSMQNVFALDSAYSKVWNRDILAAWVAKNIPAHAKIRNDNISIPSSIDKPLDITPWDYKQESSIEDFQEEGDDYAVLNLAWNQINFFWFDTPAKKLIQYDGIPVSQLKTDYHYKMLDDFKLYSTQAIYKPWQAPEDSYLIIKIPKPPHDKRKEIFHKDLSEQTVNSFSSKSIPVSAGSTYTVVGKVHLKNTILPEKRDGFFSMSFSSSTAKEPLSYSVSGRIFGEKESVVTKQFTTISPKNATSMVIDFEHYLSDNENNYEMMSVTAYEGEKSKITPVVIPDSTIFATSIY